MGNDSSSKTQFAISSSNNGSKCINSLSDNSEFTGYSNNFNLIYNESLNNYISKENSSLEKYYEGFYN